jgi:hypothetical protein
MLTGREIVHTMAQEKNPHAVALGRLATAGRMKHISPQRRREIAVHAARARWAKKKARAK